MLLHRALPIALKDRCPETYQSYLRLVRAVPPDTPSVAEAKARVAALMDRPPGVERAGALVQLARARIAQGRPAAALMPQRRATAIIRTHQERRGLPEWRGWWLKLGWLNAQIEFSAPPGLDWSLPWALTKPQLGLFHRPGHTLRRYLWAAAFLYTTSDRLQRDDGPRLAKSVEDLFIQTYTRDLPDPDLAARIMDIVRPIYQLVQRYSAEDDKTAEG